MQQPREIDHATTLRERQAANFLGVQARSELITGAWMLAVSHALMRGSGSLARAVLKSRVAARVLAAAGTVEGLTRSLSRGAFTGVVRVLYRSLWRTQLLCASPQLGEGARPHPAYKRTHAPTNARPASSSSSNSCRNQHQPQQPGKLPGGYFFLNISTLVSVIVQSNDAKMGLLVDCLLD